MVEFLYPQSETFLGSIFDDLGCLIFFFKGELMMIVIDLLIRAFCV